MGSLFILGKKGCKVFRLENIFGGVLIVFGWEVWFRRRFSFGVEVRVVVNIWRLFIEVSRNCRSITFRRRGRFFELRIRVWCVREC